jgi:hypothetical protein
VKLDERHFWRSAAGVAVAAACVLVLPRVGNSEQVPADWRQLVARLCDNRMNVRDRESLRRGYYEELDGVRVAIGSSRKSKSPVPADWHSGLRAIHRSRDDFLMKELLPSSTQIVGGVVATTNRWGMRDRDYERAKPAGCYRIVLVGSSHEFGIGVPDQQTFESLVEERLNREPPHAEFSRFEIMNLAVTGDNVLQKLLRLEHTGFDFAPDAVLFVVCGADNRIVTEKLATTLRQGGKLPFPYLEAICEQAGVDGTMSDARILQRLEPFAGQVTDWAFRRLREQCTAHRARVFVAARPAPLDRTGKDREARNELLDCAAQAGIEVIDLSPAYDRVEDPRALVLADWDAHTNTFGHRLLADLLYSRLVAALSDRTPDVQAPQQIPGAPQTEL